MEYKRGDLVYVPAEALLADSMENHKTKNYVKLKEPQVLLLIEERGNHLLVEKSGNKWYVKKDLAYKIGENDAS